VRVNKHVNGCGGVTASIFGRIWVKPYRVYRLEERCQPQLEKPAENNLDTNEQQNLERTQRE